MPLDTETFSNPPAPPSSSQPVDADEDEHRLTNDDFRSFLMTPRVGSSTSSQSSTTNKVRPGAVKEFGDSDDPHAKRRKKKLYYAKLRQQEEERQKELAAKYRDRATERREGKNSDYQHNDGQDLAKTAEYRAVAPTADQVNTAAERRRLAIQESKFLGGDMEHTHLVKGLDFALLQKVRSEIAVNESEAAETETKDKDGDEEKTEKDPAAEVDFVSVQGRKIYKAAIGNKPPQRNELFHPGRMAYVFNVEDDYEDSEIPTTTIRSKADCPLIENQTSLTTNDIVINKLTQILSYLRQGMRASKKLKKREKELIRAGKDPRMEDSIFGDIGDYNADFTLEQYNSLNTPAEEKKTSSNNYFAMTKDSTQNMDHGDSSDFSKKETSVKDFIKNINEKFDKPELTGEKSKSKGKKSKKAENVDSYAECYPGAVEMDDAVNDSDEDADYSKMDMGNKKGPLKRWDFETEEEYNKYMENKVAMPKAAFQFGIKMQEGRKTRTKLGHMSEKQKLDREWQQISSLISKRKGDGGGGSGGKKNKD